MGRRRTTNLDLPPQMHRKGQAYYYGRSWTPLGSDFAAALRKYAELHGIPNPAGPATFADAVISYRLKELPKKAAATQKGYDRQLTLLVKVFGTARLHEIKPKHVFGYLEAHHSPISATREKALLSAVFTYARNTGMTDAPNPCAGVRGKKSKRGVYVTDDDLGTVLPWCDQPTRDFLELLYRTGQDASVVLRMKTAEWHDGALWARRSKTQEATRIEVDGPLLALLTRITSYAVASVFLIRDARGQPFTLGTIRKRFWKARAKAGATWQLRDLRPKAGTDLDDNMAANRLLGHSAMSTTDGYIRRVAGRTAKPPMREIAEVSIELQKSRKRSG